MANRNVELAVRMSVDASNVAAEFEGVGDAAKRMGDDIDSATAGADTSVRRLDGVADAADNTASSTSQAAGGLGDLGGALSLLPGPLGAVGGALEATAPAVMGVTGAADLLNLATKSNIITQGRLKVALVASKVATVAQTVATRVLNTVMRANPIGIVITAALLLVGVFVTLYRKSETFRAIVDTLKDKVSDAFGAMLKPIGFVIDKIQKVVGWIGDAIDATKRALGLGKEYGSTMGRILGTVADDLAAIGDQIRNNAAAGGRGGASDGGVGAPRMITPRASTTTTTIDARLEVTFEGNSRDNDDDLVRRLEDLQRRQLTRWGLLVPGSKVVTT
jgi:hypothetical protein